MRRFLLAAGIAALLAAAAFVGFAQADPITHVGLTTVSGQGSGTIAFSPTAKNEGTNQFNVQITVNIHGATPNTVFTASRNVDFNADGICTGPTFTPFSPALTTSAGGAGTAHYDVQRGPPTLFVEGAEFDVSFRVVGTDGTVLTSECFTVTVK
jgi:opacity protein-like surface antigen